MFCFGINRAGCGKIGSRFPKLSWPAPFTGLSIVVTELPPPWPAAPPPPLHLPPLAPGWPLSLSSAWRVLSMEGLTAWYPPPHLAGWALEKLPGVTDEEPKADGGLGLPGTSQ